MVKAVLPVRCPPCLSEAHSPAGGSSSFPHASAKEEQRSEQGAGRGEQGPCSASLLLCRDNTKSWSRCTQGQAAGTDRKARAGQQRRGTGRPQYSSGHCFPRGGWCGDEDRQPFKHALWRCTANYSEHWTPPGPGLSCTAGAVLPWSCPHGIAPGLQGPPPCCGPHRHQLAGQQQ